MAIKTRVTRTITEHFDNDAAIAGDIKTQATTDGSPSLLDIKSNPTQTSSMKDDEFADKASQLTPQQVSVAHDLEAFTSQLKLWIGHNFGKIAAITTTTVLSIIASIWIAAASYSDITSSIRQMQTSISSLDLLSKGQQERILKLEFSTQIRAEQATVPQEKK